jgi:tetratricopeptide (TPR) repeat protein
MYFLASAVFFEEGKLEKALYYLDRSVKISLNSGSLMEANENTIRYAMIYQNLGRWGDALAVLEAVRKRTNTKDGIEQYFYSTVILLDVLSSMNPSLATAAAVQLTEMIPRVGALHRVALCYFTLAFYYSLGEKIDSAEQALARARELYSLIGYKDDLVRTDLFRAEVSIESGHLSAAREIIDDVCVEIRQMESDNLRGWYLLVELRYHRAIGSNKRVLLKWVSACEDISGKVTESNLAMQIHAGIFRALVNVGEAKQALPYFVQYYDQVRRIASNLQTETMVREFSNNPETLRLAAEFKKATKIGPDRSVRDRSGQ